MATNLDTLLNGTTVTVDGAAITISGLTANEQAILLIALSALEQANGRALSGGRAIGMRAARSTGVVSAIVVTPATG